MVENLKPHMRMTIPNNHSVLIASLALVAGLIATVSAAGDKWALLIGVDKCEAVGELTVCAADAFAMKSVLEQIGYPADHITMLVDNQSNMNVMPTIGNVERAIKRLAEVAEADDRILFFFSGHGVTHNGTSFIVPTDGDLKRGVNLTWIKDQFVSCKAKEKVMILDACHSGAAKGVSGITPDLKTSGNLVMLLSCEKDQVSWPDAEGRHSVFTTAVLEGLTGKAANADRKVTHLTLASYVRENVKGWTFANRKNEQKPLMVSDVSGDIILADIALYSTAVFRPTAIVKSLKMKVPLEGESWESPATGMSFVWVTALKMWVGKYEVTNGDFRKMVPDQDSSSYEGHSLNGDRQPVVQVKVSDAVAFSEWLTRQDRKASSLPENLIYRLLSEDEWLTLAKAGTEQEYPWGKEWPPRSHQAGNYAGQETEALGWKFKIEGGYRDLYVVSCEVEKSIENLLGLYGIGGNVFECCTPNTTDKDSSVWRGGAWNMFQRERLSCASRDVQDANYSSINCGFRVVLSATGGK
jgi:hypothetical protein